MAREGWRRGVTAVLAVFGAVVLALLTAPADRLGGPFGLALYALILAAGAILGARYTSGRVRA
jgi:hypothetical protein